MQERLWQWTIPATWVAGTAIALSPTVAYAPSAYGQVVPATDSTNTSVVRNGSQFDIVDGTRSGTNLFHNFETLNIEDNQTVNFLPDSDVLNIVGQVSGADPSYIEGQVQVQAGSDANLYLINPQGILFGPDAQLSLSGSFTATTADQVGFGDAWLDVLQKGNDYTGLTAEPSAFRFTADSASAVVNQGNLSVQAGESLTLMGGNVVSEGRLEAPGGEIGLMAVGGESTVRFGVPGSLLSLEVAEQDFGATVGSSFSPTDLPALLTGESEAGTDAIATNLVITPDKGVSLTGTGVEFEEVVVTGVVSTNSDDAGGGVIALVGRSVDILDAVVDASGNNGGTIRIGSDAVSEKLPASEFVLLRDTPILRAQGRQGVGGDILLSATNTAIETGTISAQGQTQGGIVETSATGNLKIVDGTIDASGQSARGRWLLNPAGIFITDDSSVLKRVAPSAIENALDIGTDVEIVSLGRDIALSDSIEQRGSSEANLTLSARRFIQENDSTISLESTGQLAFDINPVNQLGGSSIRAAIATTENINGTRSLNLSANTYEFSDTALINTNIDITGAADGGTILSATDNVRVFEVTSGATANLQNLTFTTSDSFSKSDQGGGIESSGMLNIRDSIFVDNRSEFGGAIRVSGGVANVISTTFRSNVAASQGGAIFYAAEGDFDVAGSTFTLNTAVSDGGAIANNSKLGLLSIQTSQFIENTSGADGGAIFSGRDASTMLNRSDLSDNVAARSGGAFFNGGMASLTNSALVGNQAIAGGAVANTSMLEVVNVTLSGNQAISEGGGLSTVGDRASLLLRNSTLTNNSAGQSGGGIRESNALSTQLLNTIIAGNNSPAAADVVGQFIDEGHNLIGQSDGSTGFTRSFLVGAATNPLDPQLAPIADNGSYRTHLLKSNSPAINAGRNLRLPDSDQRGFSRVVGASVDIGAVELTAMTLPAEPLNVVSPNQPAFVIASEPIPSLAALPSTALDSALLALSQLSSAPIDAEPAERKSLWLPTTTDVQARADDVAIRKVENSFSQSYRDYWDLPLGDAPSFHEVQAVLRRAQDAYQVNSAVIYATFIPEEGAVEAGKDEAGKDILQTELTAADNDILQLMLVTPQGELVTHQLPVTRKEANRQVRLLRSNVSDLEDPFGYRPLSQQLYQWLLAPLEEELADQGIQNLLYSLDEGLRTAPITAMSDPSGFSLERYGISVVPNVGLTKTDFSPRVRRSTVAMGVAEFDTQAPLPAVPVELNFVETFVPVSKTVLNEGATRDALEVVQALEQPGVLHLATHADFSSSSPENSEIHLWNDSLSMSDFRALDWESADLELLILSACVTALSSPNAELGFAGLAAAAGVDATVGSLWQVSDTGTLALMSEFYIQLENTNLRFEALRRAQLALLQGETRIQNGNLLTSRGEIELPDDWNLPDEATLDHPFFWSAFTMVGNPW